MAFSFGPWETALKAVDATLGRGREALRARVTKGEALSRAALETLQGRTHAFAWLATYGQGLSCLLAWAQRLEASGRFGEAERLIFVHGFAEYLAQFQGGVAMSQGEIARLGDLGVTNGMAGGIADGTAELPSAFSVDGAGSSARIVELMIAREGAAAFADVGLDEDHEPIREHFFRFVREQITPHAHEWHMKDALIPAELIAQMSALGVFGLTIPEKYGGAGMGKLAMCVVSEELSRGYIGAGSLGTRAEIAAELILSGGTEAQKVHFLPGIASAEILPTAVFTEPDVGSDLGALATRAEREGERYLVTGAKNWITHAARADLMTLLVRTDPESRDHRGLSMLLAEKRRGQDGDPFPDEGLTGSEIPVLGYRGMREYALSFSRFPVASSALLGGEEGTGFRQLMRTFESARIQTAARAIGVAQNALDLALRYAQERRQFGKPLVAFPRIAGKLAMMAVEIMIARQLAYRAALRKDEGRRCDLEAGMAKLLAARVAWAAADNALQIHGGNGFALEYPVSRLLCDARILSIFEGSAEIQADVIARRLLEAA